MTPKLISIITPAWKEADNLPVLYARLAAVLEGKEWEWVIIDDHSPDGTFAAIHALAQKDSRVRGIRLSRNSGSHVALTAGINQAAGANNQSINAVRISLNSGPQSIDDSVLLQQNTTTLATDSGLTPTTGSRQVVTSDQAFTGSRGVTQVVQSAGVGNRVANTLGITIK